MRNVNMGNVVLLLSGHVQEEIMASLLDRLKEASKADLLSRRLQRRVRFNEVNLGEIEANKPARKKITEPKTPFHPTGNGCLSPTLDHAGDSDPVALAEAITIALNKAAQGDPESDLYGGWTTSSEDEDPVTEKGTRTFTDKRRAHYDEYKRFKDLEQNGHFLDNGHGDGTGDSHSDLITKATEISINDGDEIVQTINIKGDDD